MRRIVGALVLAALLSGAVLLAMGPVDQERRGASHAARVSEEPSAPTLRGLAGAPPEAGGSAPADRVEGALRTVFGSVVGSDGTPVRDAWVGCSFGESDAGTAASRETTTDPEGRFAIPDVPAGEFVLRTWQDEGFRHDREQVVAAHDGPHRFVVEGRLRLAGEVRGAAPGEARVTVDRLRRRLMMGRIVEWTDVPGMRRRVRTESGRFAFDHLLPGHYRVVVEVEGVPPQRHEIEVWKDRLDVVLDVVRAPRCTLRGRVVAGAGFAGRAIRFRVNAQQVPESGDFVLADLAEGPFRLSVTVEDPVGSDASFDPWSTPIDDREYEVRVRPPVTEWTAVIEPQESVRLHVHGPAIETPIDGVLEVVAEGGAPQRIDVRVTKEGSLVRMMGLWIDGVQMAGAVEEEGFVLRSLPPGTHRVRLEIPSFEPEERSVRVEGATDVDWPLVPVEGRWARVEVDGDHWALWVRPARSGAEWTRVLWADRRDKGAWRWWSFPHEAFLAAGDYEARLVSDRYVTVEWPLRVSAEAARLAIAPPLSAGARVHGRIRAAWAEGELVHVLEEGRAGWSLLAEKVASVTEGRYELPGLAPGRYRISFSPSGEPPLADVEVGAEDRELDLDAGP